MQDPANAYESHRSDLARYTSASVLECHFGTLLHTNRRKWSARDRAVQDELISRTFGVGELSTTRLVAVPRWVEPWLEKVSETGRRMGRPGWARLVAFVVTAFRRGALGVRLTYDELAAELLCSRRTVARYVSEMQEAGLLRVLHVFSERLDGKGKRVRDSNIYQPGPKLLERWHAMIEGCTSRIKWGGIRAPRARHAAQKLRQWARLWRRDREAAARAEHPPSLPIKIRSTRPHSCAQPAPELPPAFDPAELDAIDQELAQASAELERRTEGASLSPSPDASAAGRVPLEAENVNLRSKCQVGLTTRTRLTPDPAGPEGPRPAADASGDGDKDAPLHERGALGRGDGASRDLGPSRWSDSSEQKAKLTRPKGEAQDVPKLPNRSQHVIGKASDENRALLRAPSGGKPPAPQTRPKKSVRDFAREALRWMLNPNASDETKSAHASALDQSKKDKSK